jgi:hypothetical protein
MYRNQQQSFSKAHVGARARLLFLLTKVIIIGLKFNPLASLS